MRAARSTTVDQGSATERASAADARPSASRVAGKPDERRSCSPSARRTAARRRRRRAASTPGGRGQDADGSSEFTPLRRPISAYSLRGPFTSARGKTHAAIRRGETMHHTALVHRTISDHPYSSSPQAPVLHAPAWPVRGRPRRAAASRRRPSATTWVGAGTDRGVRGRPVRAGAAGTSRLPQRRAFDWGDSTEGALELAFAMLAHATHSRATDLVCQAFCAEVVARLDRAGFVLCHGDIALWLLTAFDDQHPPLDRRRAPGRAGPSGSKLDPGMGRTDEGTTRSASTPVPAGLAAAPREWIVAERHSLSEHTTATEAESAALARLREGDELLVLDRYHRCHRYSDAGPPARHPLR